MDDALFVIGLILISVFLYFIYYPLIFLFIGITSIIISLHLARKEGD